ncbi:MAG: magnesium and cobalt exporter, family [Actinomycetota bacterium]|jgi:CBS domain containing-hemolysin-like protein|nr:magnesium and cobalt exporter, family [Actinomycetota bacterium]
MTYVLATSFSRSDTILLLAVLVLIAFSGVLAAAETSLTRMNRIKAITLDEEGRKGATKLVHLVERPERFLNPVLFLLLVCHLVAATLVGVVAEHVFGPLGVAAATAFEVIVIFVVAEAVPKTYAVQHPERAALFSARLVAPIAAFPPVRFLARALIGLANVIIPGKGLKEGPYVSEQEILAMADVAVEEEVLEREERALIHSIIEFGDTVVREVMIPRTDMVAVEGKDRVADVIEVAMAAGYSRIPVYDQGIDDVVGLIYTKDLLRAEREGRADVEVRTLVREARFVPETKRVSELMREMQKDKFHMAMVVDEYGGTAGLVTLEDLIEELVGEIVDEYDVEEANIEPLPNGDVRVNARMPIDEVNDLLHANLPTGDWDSLGGLVFNLLGHVPTEGETVDFNGHRLRAEKVQGRRIGRVRISKIPDDDAA